MRIIHGGSVLIAFSLLCHCKPHHPGHKIPPNSFLWDGSHLPEWSDFQGTVPWVTTAAATACLIDYVPTRIGDSVLIEVNNYFLRDSSWVRTNKATNYILHHERGHFDIGEIMSCQFKEYLSHWTHSETGSFAFYVLVGRNSILGDSLNKQYDRETDHSINRAEQRRWDRKIDSLLKVYEPIRKVTVKLSSEIFKGL